MTKVMTKYRIYRPGEGWLVGLFNDKKKGGAEAAAQALDKKVFRSQKAYENARDTGYLHQVREVEK
ncbi:MAG: hypothetical protein M0R74_15740 [Dehalococcoidia bacterium]|nr:hypothetical protein [Dehalococcoidia bacterium]